MLRRILVSIFMVFAANTLLATHIVGGEMSYRCLGNDDYEITLKVYRDCLNGQASFDSKAAVTTYDANKQIVRNDFFDFPGSTRLSNSGMEPCYNFSSSICVEEAVYKKTLNLPFKAGGYTISYQRCCRNFAITNLAVPGDEGATYTVHITEEALNSCNSSPRFKNYPPIAVCIGKPLELDYSAFDPDGDSLAYEFFTPFHGGGKQTGVGISGNPNGFNTPSPNPAAPPPYQIVNWRAQYNTNYQVDANPPLTIDSKTGIITGSPTTSGQYVFGVKIMEYRNGKLLSEVYRDIQFQTVFCQKSVFAKMESQIEKCKGNFVEFTNLTQTTGPGEYFWDFGVTNLNSDTSRLENPSYLYPDSGTYIVTLVSFPGYSCSDTILDTFLVYPLLEANFPAVDTQCLFNNSFDFMAGGSYSSVATFEWSFGNSATPSSSLLENPINISFADTGKYDVFLTIRENGCESTVKKPIYVYPHPIPKFGLDGYVQCSPYRLNITDSSYAKTPLSYIWEFGNSDSSTSEFPFYIYTDSGSYNIGLTVITKNGCVDTVKTDYPINVKVNPTPVANFSVFPLEASIYEPEITFTNLANLGLDCYIFTGDGVVLNTCDSTYSYLKPGVYSAAQVVKNSSGCSDTLIQNLEITGEFACFAPNAFTPNGDGQNDFFKPVIYGIESYQLSIYDRWGREVFKTTSNSKGWDGRIGRKIAAQNESYTWRVDAVDYLGNNQLFIGNVILAR